MPEPGQSEAEQKSHLVESPTLDSILGKIPQQERNLDDDTKARQEAILKNLPGFEELVQRLYGHLQSQYQEGYLDEKNKSEAKEAGMVAGGLGEILAEAEYDQISLVVGGQELVRSTEKSDHEVAEKLLGVLHNPDILIREDDPEYDIGRNPDMAWLDVNNRTVRVVGEVKLTRKLDLRCFKQLKPTGFIANIKDTIKYLNKYSRIGKRVFGEVDNKPQKGSVSEDVVEVVFLPRDTDITENNWENLIKTRKEDGKNGLDASQVAEFKELLKSGKVRLAHFSFSRREVRELSRVIMDRMKEKYPSRK